MYKKELGYYFATPVAYIVVGLYLVAVSLFLWVIPGEWNIVESGYAQADGLFQLSPWFLMLLCPALTMRLFAEERQTGTWNLLIAKKIPVWRIVLSKYMAAWTLTVIAILPCVVHYFLVSAIAEPVGNVDGAQFAGSMIGLLFLSMSFTAIGHDTKPDSSVHIRYCREFCTILAADTESLHQHLARRDRPTGCGVLPQRSRYRYHPYHRYH